MDQDLEHLRLLSIFHYVVGGIAGLFACFPCIHLVLGIIPLHSRKGYNSCRLGTKLQTAPG